MKISKIGFPRYGNKQNDIKHFKEYLPLDVDVVCEPFGGTGAVLRNIYYEDKYKKVLNDLDKDWIELLEFFKDERFFEFWEELKQTHRKPKCEVLDVLAKYGLERLLDTFCFRGYGRVSQRINMHHVVEFFKKVEFYNMDFKEMFKKYGDNEKAFLFLDPPYFQSDNSGYSMYDEKHDKEKVLIDNTKLFIEIVEFLKNCRCKVLLILNSNAITRYIYADWILGEYAKTYQKSRNKTSHLIIGNCNCKK